MGRLFDVAQHTSEDDEASTIQRVNARLCYKALPDEHLENTARSSMDLQRPISVDVDAWNADPRAVGARETISHLTAPEYRELHGWLWVQATAQHANELNTASPLSALSATGVSLVFTVNSSMPRGYDKPDTAHALIDEASHPCASDRQGPRGPWKPDASSVAPGVSSVDWGKTVTCKRFEHTCRRRAVRP